jgi:hypothetical protein
MKTVCVVSTRFSKAVLVFARLFRSDRDFVVASDAYTGTVPTVQYGT